ncbi:hypothetical protein Y032_0323g2473 [Ancylostoma ceylanicum]|uniref:Uncharacterized protein n=1 Tax=Ancylostoma ceylanicum TaxID=53326 RepID=A0A016S1G8_9BILA|nr:hypothetical protein Y032_0323g2473 [Ancylostoma ceylanicum]
MVNINETHPMRLPASIIDRRSSGRPLECRQQGAASRTMRCGYRTPRNIQTVYRKMLDHIVQYSSIKSANH